MNIKFGGIESRNISYIYAELINFKCVKTIQGEEYSFFKKWYWTTLHPHAKE